MQASQTQCWGSWTGSCPPWATPWLTWPTQPWHTGYLLDWCQVAWPACLTLLRKVLLGLVAAQHLPPAVVPVASQVPVCCACVALSGADAAQLSPWVLAARGAVTGQCVCCAA